MNLKLSMVDRFDGGGIEPDIKTIDDSIPTIL